MTLVQAWKISGRLCFSYLSCLDCVGGSCVKGMPNSSSHPGSVTVQPQGQTKERGGSPSVLQSQSCFSIFSLVMGEELKVPIPEGRESPRSS